MLLYCEDMQSVNVRRCSLSTLEQTGSARFKEPLTSLHRRVKSTIRRINEKEQAVNLAKDSRKCHAFLVVYMIANVGQQWCTKKGWVQGAMAPGAFLLHSCYIKQIYDYMMVSLLAFICTCPYLLFPSSCSVCFVFDCFQCSGICIIIRVFSLHPLVSIQWHQRTYIHAYSMSENTYIISYSTFLEGRCNSLLQPSCQ